ncbi:hypothetical protein AKA01nite_01690 [Alkalibacterium kapii]|uniref:Uncharacterized protein n=1 Tax=Alkalibacterium kapii TaxID=426704 RepID=A0A511AY62_9LACT|nr:hypothetical protein AKA01nite_01690 [Alkalibacterium kapii]
MNACPLCSKRRGKGHAKYEYVPLALINQSKRGHIQKVRTLFAHKSEEKGTQQIGIHLRVYQSKL